MLIHHVACSLILREKVYKKYVHMVETVVPVTSWVNGYPITENQTVMEPHQRLGAIIEYVSNVVYHDYVAPATVDVITKVPVRTNFFLSFFVRSSKFFTNQRSQ